MATLPCSGADFTAQGGDSSRPSHFRPILHGNLQKIRLGGLRRSKKGKTETLPVEGSLGAAPEKNKEHDSKKIEGNEK